MSTQAPYPIKRGRQPAAEWFERARGGLVNVASVPGGNASKVNESLVLDPPRPWRVPTAFPVKVVECDDASGFALVEEVSALAFHANGYLTGTPLSAAPRFYALNGPLNWPEVDAIAICLPCKGTMSDGTPIGHVLIGIDQGLNFNASPTEDSATLAAEQDDPGEHARCGDTVEP